ncbi:MAG: NYN domain-containing protein [Patescibacteria group bacterium]
MRLAIAIDMPNFSGMTRAIGHNIDLKAFLKHISHGKGNKKEIVMAYVFYDAPRNAPQKNDFLHFLEEELNFEIIFTPYKSYAPACPIEKTGKSRTDNYISVKMAGHLYKNEFDHLILVSGDSDYEPLVRACLGEGKTVEVWATKFTMANDIKRIAEIHFFEDHKHMHIKQKHQKNAA